MALAALGLALGGIGQVASWASARSERKAREKELKANQAAIRAMMSGPHPGMGGAEWRQAIGGIEAGVRGQEAQLGQMQSRFGGTVDPGAFARARAPIQAGGIQAKGSLAAQRAAMDRQFALAIESALRTGDMQAAQMAMQERQQFTQGMAGLGQMLGGIGAMRQQPGAQGPSAYVNVSPWSAEKSMADIGPAQNVDWSALNRPRSGPSLVPGSVRLSSTPYSEPGRGSYTPLRTAGYAGY